MKQILFILIFFVSKIGHGQANEENRNLVFDSTDLKIVQRANLILSDSLKWNKQDDRKCDDDIATGKYSLFCCLYKASMEIAGEYIHRRPAIEVVRFTVERYENGRVREHRLMDWNNHAATTFAEVKKVLNESIEEVIRNLK